MRGMIKAGAIVLALAIGLAWGSQAYAAPRHHGHGGHHAAHHGYGHGHYGGHGHGGYYRPGAYLQFNVSPYRGYYGGYGGYYGSGYYPGSYYPRSYSYPGYYGGYGGCY